MAALPSIEAEEDWKSGKGAKLPGEDYYALVLSATASTAAAEAALRARVKAQQQAGVPVT